ncbi:MAG: polyprenyl synthetase family protein [Candidatus Puniceispirillales bacterium]
MISQALPDTAETLGLAAHHHFEDHGKMLRAGLAISTGKTLGVDPRATEAWAAAIELLHNASLVHDDISDGDTMRRDRPSIWAAFGRDTALALGDWMIALSFEFAAKAAMLSGEPRLVSVLANRMKATTIGQAMEFELDDYPDWDRYCTIVAGKTAPLFVAPVEGIALLAGRDDLVSPVAAYFNAVGMAYQISNDILNMIGEDGAINPASDLLRRAPNAVIICYQESLRNGSSIEFGRWLVSGDHKGAQDWHQRILGSAALDTTIDRMKNMLASAESRAADIPDSLSPVVMPIQHLLARICAQSMEHAAE